MTDIHNLVENYINWLRDKTVLRDMNGWVEITTPHLDRHNDYVQIYVKFTDNGEIVITDDGQTIVDLEFSGCSLDTPKRKNMLDITLNGFGVHRRGDALEINATRDNFPIKKHNLVQAILAVNDLFVLSQPSVESFFLEDVALWMDKNDIRYVPGAKFHGRSGFEHKFDFVIPKSKNSPERLINTINVPKKDSAQNAAFSWLDTRGSRPENSQAFFFLNDNDNRVPESVMQALLNYEITPILWSARENFVEQLAA